jgi:hypothetical protein
MNTFNNRLFFDGIEVNIQIPTDQTGRIMVLALISANENDFPVNHFKYGQWEYLQNFPTHKNSTDPLS